MNTPLRLVLSITVAIGLVSLLLYGSGTGVEEIWAALARLDGGVYWAALGVQVLIYPLRALRLAMLLPRAHQVSPARLLPVTASHIMFANLLPAKVGEVSLVVYLRRVGGVPTAEGLAVLLVSRVLDFAVLCAVMAASCGVLGISGYLDHLPWLLPLSMGLAAVAVFLVWLAGHGDGLMARAQQLLGTLRLDQSRLGARMLQFAQRLEVALAGVGGRQRMAAGLVTIPIWLLVFGFYAILARGLGITELGIVPMVFGSGLAILASLVPLNGFAGFGVQDMGWALGFTVLGVAGDLAASTALAAHLIYVCNISLLGVIGNVTMTRPPEGS